MKISLNWLKDFVGIPSKVTPQQLAEDLTVSTVEVEQVIDQAQAYNKMVVGEIQEIQEHPNADKLKLCVTDIGKPHPAQIICGGLNIYKGMKVAVALPGSRVRWHGEGELVELKKTKIRGVESQGMICAAEEIGLPSDWTGDPAEPHVMDLKVESQPGTPLAKALNLNDLVIEIDNKSLTNRPDLWGHQGLAREISAIYSTKLKNSTPDIKLGKQDSKLKIEIKEPDLCRRFTACLVEGVKVADSPDWLQSRLRAVGLRPINNIVDITNYAMLDVGQPMHAFDADKLGNSIVVRQAKKDEKLKTLDGEARELRSSMVVVADKNQPVSLAGIIGGADSQVKANSKNIVFEAANWKPVSIRRTALAFDIRTDASMRFDKGLDAERTMLGMQRALQLIRELLPDAKVHAIADVWPKALPKVTVQVSHEFLEKRIGQQFKAKEVTAILERLGFGVKEQTGFYTISVPSWRATGDVSLPEDIVEEVARIYGYNNLQYQPPTVALREPSQQPTERLTWVTKSFLSSAAGMSEVYNYPWTEQRIHKVLEKYGMAGKTIKIAYPPTPENSNLARYLLHNLLKNVETNLRICKSFKIFEQARIFKPAQSQGKNKESLPEQPKRLTGLVVETGRAASDVFHETKGIATGLVSHLNLDCEFQEQQERAWIAAGTEVGIQSQGQVIGEFGLVNPAILQELKLETVIGVFYFDFEALLSLPRKEVLYQPLPEFPPVTRDLAVEVDTGVKYAELEKAIKNSSQLLEQVELFDVYEGEQIGEGQRSLAWHLSFRHAGKTLTSVDADKELDKIVKTLEKSFGVRVRA